MPANATHRAIRGQTKPQKTDGIHRAARRGASTHWRQRAEAVARELAGAGFQPELGRVRLLETRREVVPGWNAVAATWSFRVRLSLLLAVRRFVMRMNHPPQTEKERLADRLLERRPPDRALQLYPRAR